MATMTTWLHDHPLYPSKEKWILYIVRLDQRNIIYDIHNDRRLHHWTSFRNPSITEVANWLRLLQILHLYMWQDITHGTGLINMPFSSHIQLIEPHIFQHTVILQGCKINNKEKHCLHLFILQYMSATVAAIPQADENIPPGVPQDVMIGQGTGYS